MSSPAWPRGTPPSAASVRAGCGTRVRTREGRAVKVEGNPDHPVNRGALCIRGQAALQGLYNPDRITGPHRRRTRHAATGATVLEPIDWEQGQQLLVERLQAAVESGQPGRIAIVTPLLTGSLDALVETWAQATGAIHIRYEPFAFESIRAANQAVFGRGRHSPPRLLAAGPRGLVRDRLPRHVALSRESHARLRRRAAPCGRAHGAVRADRCPPVAHRDTRRRLVAGRTGRFRADRGRDGSDHRGRRPGPRRRFAGRGSRTDRRARGRVHAGACRPAHRRPRGCDPRPGARLCRPGPGTRPVTGGRGRRRRHGAQRHGRPDRGHAAELRRGQHRVDCRLRPRQQLGARKQLPCHAGSDRGDAIGRGRLRPAPRCEPSPYDAARGALRGSARRGVLRGHDVQLPGRDRGTGRPRSPDPHAARGLGRQRPARRGARPHAAGHPPAVRYEALRRSAASDRPQPRTGGCRAVSPPRRLLRLSPGRLGDAGRAIRGGRRGRWRRCSRLRRLLGRLPAAGRTLRVRAGGARGDPARAVRAAARDRARDRQPRAGARGLPFRALLRRARGQPALAAGNP